MASKPANPKMWAMIIAQAKAKYSNYPNPGSSHWVHKTYVEHGGRFIETTEADRKMGIAKKKHEKEKVERAFEGSPRAKRFCFKTVVFFAWSA